MLTSAFHRFCQFPAVAATDHEPQHSLGYHTNPWAGMGTLPKSIHQKSRPSISTSCISYFLCKAFYKQWQEFNSSLSIAPVPPRPTQLPTERQFVIVECTAKGGNPAGDSRQKSFCRSQRTVTKSDPKNAPVTPSIPKRRLASGDAMASRAFRNSALPVCTPGGASSKVLYQWIVEGYLDPYVVFYNRFLVYTWMTKWIEG